tara:strand:- start:522 stop:731 length:210 start_codon:yes stop_codon:yes gene_type:complete
MGARGIHGKEFSRVAGVTKNINGVSASRAQPDAQAFLAPLRINSQPTTAMETSTIPYSMGEILSHRLFK